MDKKDPEENRVESLEIPSPIKAIYTEACENNRILAESVSLPSDWRSATLLVQGRGKDVINRIAQLSLVRAHD